MVLLQREALSDIRHSMAIVLGQPEHRRGN